MSLSTLFARWIFAFALTQAIEMPIYRRAMRTSWSVAFGASAITHPIVVFVIPRLYAALFMAPAMRIPPTYRAAVWYVGYGLATEGFAIAGEAIYFRAFRLPHPWRWSLVGNGASATIGLIVTIALGWWP